VHKLYHDIRPQPYENRLHCQISFVGGLRLDVLTLDRNKSNRATRPRSAMHLFKATACSPCMIIVINEMRDQENGRADEIGRVGIGGHPLRDISVPSIGLSNELERWSQAALQVFPNWESQ
jgi:hypothetical protein